MTIVTHAAFGVLLTAIAGESSQAAVACALGAAMPDIDHPQSAIGRLLFPLSMPLNARFGHRGMIHAFIVWAVPLIAAIVAGSQLAAWFFIGALSHCFIDCYNVSGVKALLPFTEKTVVLFKRDWRVITGSLKEIWVFIFFFVMICGMGYAHVLGGPRKLINMLVHSHKITVEEYQRAGLKRCTIEGTFRWADGRKEEMELLVVGLDGRELIAWDGEKLLCNPKHGKWLKSVLHESEQDWLVISVDGIAYAKQPCFYFAGKKWRYAKTGDMVMGSVKTATGEGLPEIRTEGL
jgi:inner membrane protein